MREMYRTQNGSVHLSDSDVNLAILNANEPKEPGHRAGLYHFGFQVEDLQEACAKLEKVQGTRLTQKEGLDRAMGPRGPRNFEMKWAGPDGVVIDVSHTGWDGTM